MTLLFDDIRAKLAASVGGEKAFAQSFSHRTMRDLDARAHRELSEAASEVVGLEARIANAITAEKLEAFHEFDEDAFLARYVRLWSAYQHAGMRTANWFVTGPANFPAARNQKRIATQDRRYSELHAFVTESPARAVQRAKAAKRRALGADGLANEELAGLKAKLADLERKHSEMKTTNAVIRRHKFKEGDGLQLSEALAREGIVRNPNFCGMVLQPNYMGQGGYEAFQLSNANANIKRTRDRIAEVERKAERIASGAAPERIVNGVRVVEDTADDRLRLIFDGKPEPDIIAALKRRGFRWSPSNTAWQRQLTNNAREAAQGILAQMEAA